MRWRDIIKDARLRRGAWTLDEGRLLKLNNGRSAIADVTRSDVVQMLGRLRMLRGVVLRDDLSLRGMMKTRMAGSLADAGLGGFIRTLHYKAEWAGRTWRVMPRFQRSTGVCPDCGLAGPKLPLSVREWACVGCGVVHDRDVAAARAICAGAVGQALPEPASSKKRKRGFADQGGDLARAGSSLGGPPSNVHHLSAAAFGLPNSAG